MVLVDLTLPSALTLPPKNGGLLLPCVPDAAVLVLVFLTASFMLYVLFKAHFSPFFEILFSIKFLLNIRLGGTTARLETAFHPSNATHQRQTHGLWSEKWYIIARSKHYISLFHFVYYFERLVGAAEPALVYWIAVFMQSGVMMDQWCVGQSKSMILLPIRGRQLLTCFSVGEMLV